ncbi:Radical S-adenosyl methionine domain-containing protein 1, mitochondrial [Geodia barretti]|uniref:Radical S-adenosyl methionine domain-containing protein 1, mitochondrial n=1 Tax=Geodia barretti TaxID=519541 RepID=A0AA35TCQ3_GEOBA|nr:Radical S-adenosyl methionine domain-containing protein 1, mitochondrial [Geodia barretti]
MKLGRILCYKWTEKGTVYVHWPYCSQLCTYCNFNKYISNHRSSVDHTGMTKCLVKELTSLIKLSGIGTVTSVYFGGGTPSLAKPETIQAVLNTIREQACLTENAEVTLEANPTSAQTEKLRTFKTAGVTRLSVGVQSFLDEDLKLMNRDHSVAESEHCLKVAQKLFPDRFNIDVIFGRPHQTLSSWVKELRKAIGVGSKHVSLYQLTVERGTPLARAVNRNEVVLPPSDAVAEMYEASIEMLNEGGLKRYEISNFSAAGCESQHNLAYWKGSNYVGIGPGAHSRFLHSGEFVASVNTLEPNAWMNKVKANGHGLQRMRHMENRERLEEVVAMSMRTVEGVTNEIWERFEPRLPLQHVFSDHWLTSTGHTVVDKQ